MTQFRPVSIALAALLLSACGGRDPVAEDAELPPAELILANEQAAGEMPEAQPEDEPGSGPIPKPLRGRWGLTPAACEAPPGADEGLLVVSAEELQFYESSARPAADMNASDDSISGDFLFVGEGTQETRFHSLKLQDGKLTRSESGSGKSFTYVRC